MTVYLTQENPRFNVLKATKFGQLESLTTTDDQIYTSASRVVAKIKRGLKTFGDEDWLLLLGDPAVIGVCFALAAERNGGRVNILKWDKFEKAYYPISVRLKSGIADLET